MKILLIPTLEELRPTVRSSSDAIGYGITSAGALISGLVELGHEVCYPSTVRTARESIDNIERSLLRHQLLSSLPYDVQQLRPDAIVVFHSFNTPAAVVRKMLCEAGHRVPLVGFLHGSHWDGSDTFRQTDFPGLEFLDLANVLALDRALVVSQSFHDLLTSEFCLRLPPWVCAQLANRLAVVPIPIATPQLDAARTLHRDADGPITLMFNHSPISAKRPDIFLDAARLLMDERPIELVLTRCFVESAYASPLEELIRKHPGRVHECNDLSVDDYFTRLWTTHIQVSTSEHESLGVATLEAMYTGNACLLPSNIEVYAEINQHDAMALYEPGVGGLHRAIVALLDQPTARRGLGERQREYSRRFGPLPVAQQLVKVLDAVLGGSKQAYGETA